MDNSIWYEESQINGPHDGIDSSAILTHQNYQNYNTIDNNNY